MAARTALNTILRDAAKTPLLRMTVPVCPGVRRDDKSYASSVTLTPIGCGAAPPPGFM
jgi:hypothetical protein